MEFGTFAQLTAYMGVDVEYGTAYKAVVTLWQLLKEGRITDQEIVALAKRLREEDGL